MDRRTFVALASSLCWAASLAARAQGIDRTRAIGLLIVNEERDPEGQARAARFRSALLEAGWQEGRNVRLDVRWGADDPERAAAHVRELLALRPDVIVVNGSPALSALQRATTKVPVVFVVVTDPLGSGYVRNLAHPGANVTGFSTFSPEIGGKWLGLLKELAPDLRRVACILDPDFRGFAAISHDIEAAAPRLGLAVSNIAFRGVGDDLESAVAAFARESRGGLVVFPTAINNAARERIISLAARYRLPAIYPFAQFADAGGLLAYGFDPADLFASGAGYVARILGGESPGNLPVQAPTRFDMIVNIRTAKALGLRIPPQFLARANRVIE